MDFLLELILPLLELLDLPLGDRVTDGREKRRKKWPLYWSVCA